MCVCVCFVTPQSKPLERLNVKMVSFQLAVVAVADVTSARHVEKKCDHMPRRWFIVMKIVGLEPKKHPSKCIVSCHTESTAAKQSEGWVDTISMRVWLRHVAIF